MTHRYSWKNNPVRASLYGKACRILACGTRGTVAVEFENGERMYVSRRALRKIPSSIPGEAEAKEAKS